MTLVNIDLRNQGYETGPDDRVIFYSLLVREGDFGTISTAPVEVRLTDGKATIDLAPGPVGVQIIARQVADTRVRLGEVPSSGPTTLNAVMMVTPAYTPALQKMMIAAVERAKELALTKVDSEVAKAVSGEVGEFKAKAEQALAKSVLADSKSDTALSKSTTAESSASNAVSRVEALEVMGGLAPGEPVDGQQANLISQPGTLTRKALDSSYVTHISTAAQLTDVALPVGAVVRTNGFHSLGDGGACTYLTIPSVEKSYDLPGVGCAYRPQNESGVISPKQFGTYNNGSDFDNFALQACYDFSADYNVQTIDGQGLTYTIGPVNPYNAVVRGFAHKGALMRSGRTIRNANFFTHASSVEGTCSFSVDLIDDGIPTYIENCSFDGNRDALIPSVSFRGREDAGMHLVHLYNRAGEALPMGGIEFTPTGDIFFTGCTFSNAFSYGVTIIEPIDALLRLTDSIFDMQAICVLMHATRVEIDGADVTMGTPRTGMGPYPFHAEAEMSGDYSGSKKLSVDVRRVRARRATGSFVGLVKVHYVPMQGVCWDSIVIEDVECSGTIGVLEIYTGTNTAYPWNGSTLEIGRISLTRCKSGTRHLIWLSNPGSGGNPIHVGEINVDKVRESEYIYLNRINIDVLAVEEYQMGGIPDVDTPFFISNTSILTFEIGELTGDTYLHGFMRDFTSTIVDNLIIKGGRFTQHGTNFIEANINRARIDGLEVIPEGSGTRRVLQILNQKSEISLSNMLMKGSTNAWHIVSSETLTEGWIHARNVRHISGLTPIVRANTLPAERKILDQVAPLISDPAGG